MNINTSKPLRQGANLLRKVQQSRSPLCVLPLLLCCDTLLFSTVFYGASSLAERLNEVSRLGINTVAGNLTAKPVLTHNSMSQSSSTCVIESLT